MVIRIFLPLTKMHLHAFKLFSFLNCLFIVQKSHNKERTHKKIVSRNIFGMEKVISRFLLFDKFLFSCKHFHVGKEPSQTMFLEKQTNISDSKVPHSTFKAISAALNHFRSTKYIFFQTFLPNSRIQIAIDNLKICLFTITS